MASGKKSLNAKRPESVTGNSNDSLRALFGGERRGVLKRIIGERSHMVPRQVIVSDSHRKTKVEG